MDSPVTKTATLAIAGALTSLIPVSLPAQQRFSDDFERDLRAWEVHGGDAIRIRATDDPSHRHVLELTADGWDVYALIKGSDAWRGVRIEGEFRFPDTEDAYLCFLYNYIRTAERTDFGCVYIKGDGSYLRVNPHRDGNVGRTLYEELGVRLTGPSAVRTGEWHRFKVEVMGRRFHLYVGETTEPQITTDLYERDRGSFGFQPRSIGWPVWLDNIRATSISQLDYTGPPIPSIRYAPDSLITAWEVHGPLAAHDPRRERAPDGGTKWRHFATDARGAVVTGRVTSYVGAKTVAYFRTTVTMPVDTTLAFHVSSVDDWTLFVNGQFGGFYARQPYAWHDFWSNPEHTGRKIAVRLRRGTNSIVVRVRGGQYATGGFFARWEPFDAPVRMPYE